MLRVPCQGKNNKVLVTLRESKSSHNSSEIRAFAEALGVSEVFARVLACRGISNTDSAQKFLYPSFKTALPNPFEIKNIKEGGLLILDHVSARKRITVFSDFDVDGLSASSQLVLFLHALGGRVKHYVPNRFTEGYGLSKGAVESVNKLGSDLLVTVDCGISNFEEIAYAKALGMQVVVVDHHQPHGLPPADVVIDPAQDGCSFQSYKLAAAGLCWMLLIVLRKLARDRRILGEQALSDLLEPKHYLDLAALGTICDMVPLTELNRLIAYRGLEALQRTSREGLIALKKVAGVEKVSKLNSGHIGFALGPRINAAGRLSEADEVFELLTTKDPKRAEVIAEKVNSYNKQRQQIEKSVLNSCLEQISLNGQSALRNAIAVFGEDYHSGVIGIVAQRIVERFYKPAAVMSCGEAKIDGRLEKVIKGSVRSVEGFHVADVLNSLSDLCITCGGHAAAGGFTLLPANLEKFKQAFCGKADELLTKEMLVKRCKADIKIDFNEINFDLVNELQRLSPFGLGNPSPVFVCEHLSLSSVQSLSKGHLRLRISDGEKVLQAVAWNFEGHPLLKKGSKVNLAFSLGVNTYKGLSSIQMDIKDVW